MVETILTTTSVPVLVSHQECANTDGLTLGGLNLTANNCQPNTLSTISIGLHNSPSKIFLHWESHSSAKELHVLLHDATETLFVGGGTISVTIRTPELAVVNKNDLTLFWSFERRRDFVLELGELDCYLYRTTGECIGHASVDPPYEIDEKEAAINFQSIVAGSQWIAFPTD